MIYARLGLFKRYVIVDDIDSGNTIGKYNILYIYCWKGFSYHIIKKLMRFVLFFVAILLKCAFAPMI